MPASAPSFAPSYDRTLDELEEKRTNVQKEIIENAGPREELPLPIRNIYLTYLGPDDVLQEASLVVRLLTHDEILKAGVYAAQLAGVNINILPAYMQSLALGRAYIAVMWGKNLPEWLKKVVETDEDVVFELYNQIEDVRRTFFRRDPGEGVPGAQKPGLRVSTKRTASTPSE